MTAHNLLSDALLSRAAFLLLSSSSQARYRRIAEELAGETGLADRVSQNQDLARVAIARAEHLWGELLSSTQRDVQEFELAVLLAVLVDAGVWDLDDSLQDIESSKSASTAWLRGLATHLRRRLFAMHYAKLAEELADWMARPHNDVPGFDPDMLTRAQVDAA